jgi:uncharacterized protein YeaO (DUF488 family)
MAVQVKRAYIDAGPEDGYRVLVDRLWPRGRTKAALRLDRWAKELGPTTELRKWFGHDPARWDEFQRRYRAELASPGRTALLADLVEHARMGPLTLVYGARDEVHNEARVIAEEITHQTPAAGPDAARASGGQAAESRHDRERARQHGQHLAPSGAEDRELDEASRQSFPASDSPAWSGGGTISPGTGSDRSLPRTR